MTLKTTKWWGIFIATGALGIGVSNIVLAATVSVNNGGFENSYAGWTNVEPTAISSVAYSGNNALKITGSGGKVEQNVSVQPNTNYTLVVYVKGKGKIGALVNGVSYSATTDNEEFTPVSVTFNSSSASSITLYAHFNGDEGRFDDFSLQTGTSTDSPTDNTCSGTDSLVITSASDNGTNDGHGPLNTLDNNLADESRWSSNGVGKVITYDVGSTVLMKALDVYWYKATERNSYFDIDVSDDNSIWTSLVANGSSSTSIGGYQTVDFTDTQARYLRITGLGNSVNNWNSIVESNIIGCGGEIAEPTPDIPDETDNTFDMSLWDQEGSDPTVGNTFVFKALEEKYVTPNGNGWRHELKIKEELRVAMTKVYENFSANIKVEMSDGSKAIVAQHHASDTGTIMKLYVSDNSESGFIDSTANNGIFDVYVRLAKADGSGEEKKALGTIQSGDNFDFQVINDHGNVTVSAFGKSFNLDIEDSSASYLKFGNYLQAQDPITREDVDDSSDWADFYADQGITVSKLTFSNVNYIRNVD
ncbi:hypothetical protein GMES_3901 [Paraglaciecola mesophila KMM 241]|uniref:F5/8 type C domain-containing protein n=1 Tax=Paraglaciecola mesophila KMM 241 TaxID=1128912 RepID=K6Y010_9ALTE|nr:polysaccharide lyase family 7 protein [Paraglaciecola mesophila]GAC26174.1 hypothetical protein GMES_3901 [Paraglaciecola mesophila KMM 241]